MIIENITFPYVCPKCNKVANSMEEIEEKFGFQIKDGKKVSQSWCRECRSLHLEKTIKRVVENYLKN